MRRADLRPMRILVTERHAHRGITTTHAERTAKEAEVVLTRALHRHQPELGAHNAGVSHLAAATGERLGLEPTEVVALVRAAELHDIGKMMIPEAILEKRGALSDDEWDVIRQHTIFGERILRSTRALAPLGPVVRSTHERFDGTGYPDGLAGEEIPLAARIIFACDAYDAMTSKRPYAKPRRPHEARAELRRCAGSQFDPEVVDALCAVLQSKTSVPRWATKGAVPVVNGHGHGGALGHRGRPPIPA